MANDQAEWRKYETDEDRAEIARLVELRDAAQAKLSLKRKRIKDRCIKRLRREAKEIKSDG